MHNYAVPTLEKILAEDRKYGLGLVLATRYLEQMPQDVLGAIMGNANTVAPAARCAVGAAWIEAFKKEFCDRYEAAVASLEWHKEGLLVFYDCPQAFTGVAGDGSNSRHDEPSIDTTRAADYTGDVRQLTHILPDLYPTSQSVGLAVPGAVC